MEAFGTVYDSSPLSSRKLLRSLFDVYFDIVGDYYWVPS